MTVSVTGVLAPKFGLEGAVLEKCTTTNMVTPGAAPDTITVSALGNVVANLAWKPANNDWEGNIATHTVVATTGCAVALCTVTLTYNVTRGADGTTQIPALSITGGLLTLGTFVVIGNLL
jgi:uncharacterized membrane protein